MSSPSKEAELAEARKEYEEQKEENDDHDCTSGCGNDYDCPSIFPFPDFNEWLLEQ